jgi:hypothetical protein
MKFHIQSHRIMSSSTKREVSHDTREIEPKQIRSSRLNKKHPGSHSRKYSTSTKDKTSKIVKLSSSTEKAKLKTLYSPNKNIPKVIKSHEDSDNSSNKSKSSSKCPFGVHQTYLQELKSYLIP